MRNAPALVLGTMLGFLVCHCSLNPQPLPPDQPGDAGGTAVSADRADAGRTADAAAGTFGGSGTGADHYASTPSGNDSSLDAAAKDAADDGPTDAGSTTTDAPRNDDAGDDAT